MTQTFECPVQTPTAPGLFRFGPASTSGPTHLEAEEHHLVWEGETGVVFPDPNIIHGRIVGYFENSYDVRGRAAVQRFVAEHQDLVAIVLEAILAVARCFGPDHDISLEVITDPEAEDERELVAFVHTSLPATEAMVCLRTLQREWLLERLDRTRGRFNVNLILR